MIRHTLCVAALILVGFVPMLAAQGADKPAPAAKELFNGKTLEGWKVTDFGGRGKGRRPRRHDRHASAATR